MKKTRPKRVIHLYLTEELIESSEELQNNVIKDDDLVFFHAHTGSRNSWFCFIFGMGLKKAKEEIERFKRSLESDYGNKDRK